MGVEGSNRDSVLQRIVRVYDFLSWNGDFLHGGVAATMMIIPKASP